ncbi:hypothetical protein EKG37_09850 [Robertmurraya yapensis]|uniref:Uncharacterized protein n=2 Tax=Bacillaceae TaxID=186817 RepID=A0A3S0JZJ5_9BACI|nr:hypothetical protein [Bacillus yapensis]RTR32456.1 hypothetical protein EKG37_09850 [Bacillus yapensis]TKS96650.1 hypothetical protein FAR12_09850 [Bacillus yapensis]
MYLTYEDVSLLFPEVAGIKNVDIDFQTISFSATAQQPKGLFIPLNHSSGELKLAIANGAIAAVWKKGMEIPTYTPNHFPILFTEDLLQAVKKILLLYKDKMNTNKKENMTDFLFLDEKLLNDFYETYDNAVIETILNEMLEKFREEKE